MISLLLRVGRTLVDLLVIASCVGLGILMFKLIKGAWSSRTTRRQTRTLNSVGKTLGFTVQHLYFGMFATMSWNICHKRNESFLGKPDQVGTRPQFHLADFPERLKGGIIVFPKTAKEVITQRFRSSFPNDLYDFVLSVIEALIPTASKYNRKRSTFLTHGTQAVVFGLPPQEGCSKDCYENPCLDVAGVSSEFLFVLTSELLTIFDQPSAILKPEDWGGIWEVRRISYQKKLRAGM